MNRPAPEISEPSTTPERPSRSKRWTSTAVWGAVPVLALASLTVWDHIPFTDVSLTVPFAAEGPGPVFDTLADVDGEPVVSISGAETDPTSGELNMTTVSVRTEMTLAQALGRWLTSNDTIVPIEQVIPPDRTPEEIQEANQTAFLTSESAATVAAMNYLGADVEVVVADTIEGSPARDVIEAGDVIVAVDGESVDSPGQVQDVVRSKSPGDEVTLTLRRDDRELDLPVTLGENPEDPNLPVVGVLMVSEPVDDVDVQYNLQDVGGPSAGMIFSLAVIDKLSPGELNGGRDVAGTGTISEDGTVGPIGGIEHKVTAAAAEGAELFLAPAQNCSEAMTGDHGDMVVASVETLDDAIAAMDAFARGDDVVTCEP